MSVVNVLSTQITNDEATPPVRSNPYIAGGGDVEFVDVCTVGASDSAGSTYRFFRVPSNARVIDIQAQNVANTSGTSYKVGVLNTDPNGGAVPVANADTIFGSGISMATARAVWTSIFSPTIAGGSASPANVGLRVWELLGLASDPAATYDVAVSAVTPGTAGGAMALRMAYVR